MALAIFGHKKVHAELVIPAPPAAIWAVLTDGPSYKEWNPVLVDAVGEHKEGATLTYQMKDPSGKTTAVNATVIGLKTRTVVESREVTILADRSVPFSVVKKVMSTCTSEGFEKISLAVLQKGAEVAKAG